MKNKKSLGQHWLKDRGVLTEIAGLAAGDFLEDREGFSEAGEESNELCLEIGPGLGFLTSALLRRFKRVVAVEFDADLARKLPGSFPGKELEVVCRDILEFDFSGMPEGYVVAGNIPYYITSPIVRKLLEVEVRPARIVLLVQREVAERIAAGADSLAGKGKRGFLSVFAQNRAEVFLGPVVGREMFTPPPKVDSRVVVLVPKEKDLIGEGALGLARVGFVAPRKKLAGVLAGQGEMVERLVGRRVGREEIERGLEEIGVGKDVRAGDLGVLDWGELYEKLQG